MRLLDRAGSADNNMTAQRLKQAAFGPEGHDICPIGAGQFHHQLAGGIHGHGGQFSDLCDDGQ